jgi:hypothetical protein
MHKASMSRYIHVRAHKVEMIVRNLEEYSLNFSIIVLRFLQPKYTQYNVMFLANFFFIEYC